MLSELRIEGCPKIQALDKMRLIAKVKLHICSTLLALKGVRCLGNKDIQSIVPKHERWLMVV